MSSKHPDAQPCGCHPNLKTGWWIFCAPHAEVWRAHHEQAQRDHERTMLERNAQTDDMAQ